MAANGKFNEPYWTPETSKPNDVRVSVRASKNVPIGDYFAFLQEFTKAQGVNNCRMNGPTKLIDGSIVCVIRMGDKQLVDFKNRH